MHAECYTIVHVIVVVYFVLGYNINILVYIVFCT